jgi:hypothetical protein
MFRHMKKLRACWIFSTTWFTDLIVDRKEVVLGIDVASLKELTQCVRSLGDDA